MPQFKNKETGEIKSFPRVRQVVRRIDGEDFLIHVNLEDDKMDMTAWETYNDPDFSYNVRVTKSRTDGHGIR